MGSASAATADTTTTNKQASACPRTPCEHDIACRLLCMCTHHSRAPTKPRLNPSPDAEPGQCQHARTQTPHECDPYQGAGCACWLEGHSPSHTRGHIHETSSRAVRTRGEGAGETASERTERGGSTQATRSMLHAGELSSPQCP
eukprot:3384986-Prymnesium_polylepis.1